MGVLGNLTAMNAAVAARELQKQGKANGDLPAMIAQLLAEQRRTNELLQALLERNAPPRL